MLCRTANTSLLSVVPATSNCQLITVYFVYVQTVQVQKITLEGMYKNTWLQKQLQSVAAQSLPVTTQQRGNGI